MGVLEDAIRQHLELKRRHGASEEEVERQEAEALGPARREPGVGVEEPPVEEPPVGEPPVAEPPADEPLADEPLGEEPPEPLAEEEPEDLGAEAEAGPPPWDHERAVDEPLEEAGVEDDRPARLDVHEEATRVYDPDEPFEDERRAGDPLDEPPEGDRLWPEQRPPRDFDFD